MSATKHGATKYVSLLIIISLLIGCGKPVSLRELNNLKNQINQQEEEIKHLKNRPTSIEAAEKSAIANIATAEKSAITNIETAGMQETDKLRTAGTSVIADITATGIKETDKLRTAGTSIIANITTANQATIKQPLTKEKWEKGNIELFGHGWFFFQHIIPVSRNHFLLVLREQIPSSLGSLLLVFMSKEQPDYTDGEIIKQKNNIKGLQIINYDINNINDKDKEKETVKKLLAQKAEGYPIYIPITTMIKDFASNILHIVIIGKAIGVMAMPTVAKIILLTIIAG